MAKKWWYNSNSGSLAQGDADMSSTNVDYGFALAVHTGFGWHGPFDTKQAALDYYNRNRGKNPGWQPPTESKADAAGQLAAGTAQKAADAAGKGLGFDDNAIRSWLIRIGEILLGVVLVGVGVAKLTGASNVVSQAVKARI